MNFWSISKVYVRNLLNITEYSIQTSQLILSLSLESADMEGTRRKTKQVGEERGREKRREWLRETCLFWLVSAVVERYLGTITPCIPLSSLSFWASSFTR